MEHRLLSNSYQTLMNAKATYSPDYGRDFVVLSLLARRCYEICAILLPLRCAFARNHFLPKSKFSDSGRKPWTVVLTEIEVIVCVPFTPCWKVLCLKLRFVPFCSP